MKRFVLSRHTCQLPVKLWDGKGLQEVVPVLSLRLAVRYLVHLRGHYFYCWFHNVNLNCYFKFIFITNLNKNTVHLTQIVH
jgi:hypothetical protein